MTIENFNLVDVKNQFHQYDQMFKDMGTQIDKQSNAIKVLLDVCQQQNQMLSKLNVRSQEQKALHNQLSNLTIKQICPRVNYFGI